MRHIPMYPLARPFVRLRVSAFANVTRSLVGLIALCAVLLPATANAVPPTGIEGTVTNGSSAGHEPVVGLNVCVSEINGGKTTFCSNSQAGGKYAFGELKVGEYSIDFTGEVCGPLPNGFSCEGIYVKKIEQPVVVTSGILTKVDVALLEVDGEISGQVTSGGTAVGQIEVCALGLSFECTTTGAGGQYTIQHLLPGPYYVEFIPLPPPGCKPLECQPADYIAQYWHGALALEAAIKPTVKESEVTPGINGELQPGGHITGKVTNASIYAEAIAGVHVCSKPTRTNKQGSREGIRTCAYTNGAGEYTIGTLASGGYEVEFTGEVCVEEKGVKCTHPYLGEIYPGVVSVMAPGTTTGINGSLLEVSPTKPVNIAAPTITAAVYVKAGPEILTCSAGSWANKPTSLAYRWLRNGSAIAGQTTNTYTVQSADAGHGISCEVTASNAAGSAASTSNTVQIPKPAPGMAVFRSVSVKGSTVSVTLLCTGASACSGTVKIVARVKTSHGKHKKTTSVTIGSAHFSMALGKTATAKLRLTAKGSKLLSQAGKRGLKVQIAGTGLQAHNAVVKAAAKHHH